MKAFLLAAIAAFSFTAHAKQPGPPAPKVAKATKVLKVDKKRLVEVIGPIGFGIVQSEARKVEELSRKSKKPIYILLNSPGGSVPAGISMIDAVQIAKNRGSKVICFSGVVAASMAFNIMAVCDERYALPNTKLLFHPVSLSGNGMRLAELLISAEAMSQNEKVMMHQLRDKLGLTWKAFHRHYFAETLWTGTGLEAYAPKFLTGLLKDAPGVKNLFVHTKPREGFFFNQNEQKHPLIKRLEQTQ